MFRLIRNSKVNAVTGINSIDPAERSNSVSLEKLRELLANVQQITGHKIEVATTAGEELILTIDDIIYEI